MYATRFDFFLSTRDHVYLGSPTYTQVQVSATLGSYNHAATTRRSDTHTICMDETAVNSQQLLATSTVQP